MRNYLTKGPRASPAPNPASPREKWDGARLCSPRGEELNEELLDKRPQTQLPRGRSGMVRDYAHRGVRNSMRNYLTKGPKPSFPEGEVGWCEIMLTEG